MNYLKAMFDTYGNIKREIPSTYKQVEYLYSPTTQRILVNAPLNTGDIIETKATTTSRANYKTIIGSGNDAKFELYFDNKSPLTYGAIAIISTAKDEDEVCTIKAKITANQLTSFFIFDYGAGNYPLNGMIYYLKITRNNQDIFNFIPCLDDKNEPCMYDSINKKTYYNVGTDSFIAGPII